MIDPTLERHRSFEASARHGRFGRAAESCAICRPALSMQIEQVEESPGTDRNACSFINSLFHNIPTKDNPRTGRITALSIVAALRRLVAPVTVGS